MRIDRTRNARNGIAMGLILRAYQTVVPFAMRTVMIRVLGAEYLGLSGLFTSVLHILSLAELGVGAAMVFSMYRPIAQDDTRRICALMRLYRTYYRIIGLAILAAGLMIMPFVPRLISGEIPQGINVHALYLLNLIATVLTYWLFAYRTCLLQAHQRQDVISMITILSSTVQFALQFWVLIRLRNYYAYVLAMLLGTIVSNMITAAATRRMYPLYAPGEKLEKREVRAINQRIRDLFSAKLGSVVLRHADTVVISAFLGLTMLAVYQNYYYIVSAVFAMIEVMIASVTAGIANSFQTEAKQKNEADLMRFSFLYLWLIGVCTCCFLGMVQPFIEIWVGRALMLRFGIVAALAMYFYVYTLMRLLSVYKDAAGLWHEDRFRPLISAGVNLLLNLLTVRAWGIYGVVLSTVLSKGLVSIPWMMRILFLRLFNRQTMMAFVRQLLTFVLMTAAAGITVCLICSAMPLGPWGRLMMGAVISAAVPNLLFYLLTRSGEQFGQSMRLLRRMMTGTSAKRWGKVSSDR